MVTGEADWVPADVRDVFMATGTVHILSISGSHLGLIAWLLFVATTQACRLLPERWLLTLTRHVTPSRLAVLATGVATALYTLLAGAQIATMRSFVMIVLFLLAIWLGHPHRVLLTWSVAALLILWHDPRALFDISFQFSYLAVLTIALVLQRREEQGGPGLPPVGWSDRARSQLWEAAVMTAAVTLMTLPLSAYYFNQWPWLGLVSNLVIVPFAGFVFVPVGLLSAGAVIVTGAPALPGAEVVNGIGRMLLALVDALAAVPAADWHVASPAVLALAVFYGAIAATWWSLRSSALRVAGAVIASLLLVWWTWSPRFNDPDVTTVTFLDVGQGDAAVIERGDRVILVDGGSRFETLDMGRAVVGPYLWDRGIRRVDAVIATHPQLDHVGGLAWLVEHFEVGRIWTNGVDREEAFYRRLVDEAAARHVPLVAARAGDLVFGDAVCTMRVLNPPISGVFATPVSTPSGSMLNNLSVVTRLACGTHSVLFTADIERLAIQRLAMDLGFDAEVVKIPHHGAASSFDAEWIATLHARTAVASVGRHNAYGHPIPAVLSTYEKQGIAVLRTDRDGAVQVRLRSSPGPVEVAETRRLAIQAVPQSVGWLRAEWRNLERLGHRWLGLTALS
jgi:competence protein ComEC